MSFWDQNSTTPSPRNLKELEKPKLQPPCIPQTNLQTMHSSNKLANQATSSQTRQRPPFPRWQSCAWASKSVFPASSQRTPWETQHTDRETNSKAKIKSADETPSMTWKHGPSDMLPHMWRKATNIAMVSHRASCEKHFLCGSTSWTSSVTCFGGAKDSVCCPFTCLFLSFMSRRPETNWLNWLRVLTGWFYDFMSYTSSVEPKRTSSFCNQARMECRYTQDRGLTRSVFKMRWKFQTSCFQKGFR